MNEVNYVFLTRAKFSPSVNLGGYKSLVGSYSLSLILANDL